MSIQKATYFSTGEFAKLCKVNKQTLIYYDQIGLFSPMHKDDKGYRYYSLAQYDFFSVIELLKDVGMSLKEIQSYMAQKSPENFTALMKQQKKIVHDKIKELKWIEHMIETKIDLVESAASTDFEQITIQQLPERTLYLSPQIKNTTEEQFVAAVSDFIDELYHSKLDSGLPIGALLKKEQIQNKDFDNYSYLYMEQPKPPHGYDYLIIPATKYVIGYHFGTYQTVAKTYEKLFSYMEEHALQFGDYAYEEYVYDAFLQNDIEDYITKVLIEIRSS